jgi:hypothetical protein
MAIANSTDDPILRALSLLARRERERERERILPNCQTGIHYFSNVKGIEVTRVTMTRISLRAQRRRYKSPFLLVEFPGVPG